MAGVKTYSFHEVKAAFEQYETAQAFSVMKDGKWTHTPLVNGVKQPRTIDGTAARTQALDHVMGFPEFLKSHWKG